MCYNKDVSIGTYILGIVGCYNLYINYGYKVEAIFFAWVVQMQLIEYFLWENQVCNDTNKITTNVGAIVNHAEPVILWIAILLLSSKQLPHWVNLLMAIFIIVSIFYTKYILDDLKDDNCTNITPESKPHLFWKWNNKKYAQIYYAFFLLCLNILVINGVDKGYHLSILINMSFFISGIIYGSKKSVGAMWCFIAAFSPWIIPHFYQINLSLI
jgi:hypothetical protein